MAAPERPSPVTDRLIEEHADVAYAAAFRLTGNAADAADLVQEAFLRAMAKAELYDPAFAFGPWLHRILFRVYLNRRRGAQRRREVPLEPRTDDDSGPADLPEQDGSESPEAALERSELQRSIAQALDSLPELLRACVILVDVEGRAYDEAACILGWPWGSVAGRLYRARRLLRERLSEEGV